MRYQSLQTDQWFVVGALNRKQVPLSLYCEYFSIKPVRPKSGQRHELKRETFADLG